MRGSVEESAARKQKISFKGTDWSIGGACHAPKLLQQPPGDRCSQRLALRLTGQAACVVALGTARQRRGGEVRVHNPSPRWQHTLLMCHMPHAVRASSQQSSPPTSKLTTGCTVSRQWCPGMCSRGCTDTVGCGSTARWRMSRGPLQRRQAGCEPSLCPAQAHHGWQSRLPSPNAK